MSSLIRLSARAAQVALAQAFQTIESPEDQEAVLMEQKDLLDKLTAVYDEAMAAYRSAAPGTIEANLESWTEILSRALVEYVEGMTSLVVRIREGRLHDGDAAEETEENSD